MLRKKPLGMCEEYYELNFEVLELNVGNSQKLLKSTADGLGFGKYLTP
jgi:hypothetical protein